MTNALPAMYERDLARYIDLAERRSRFRWQADVSGPGSLESMRHTRALQQTPLDPRGRELHGLELAPGEVVRLTQTEVEAHPAWQGFGNQAAAHPPMRGWLATAVFGEDG
jgi:hypothetical protein